MNPPLEIRAALELRVTAPRRLAGYAARYGRESEDLGGFRESIRAGAFARSLRAPDHIVALAEHDRHRVLGRVGAGTLQLEDDADGIRFLIDLPDTSYARDLEALVARGDVSGASFAFTTPAGGDRWTERAGVPHRELVDVDLHEITVTSMPAYRDTSVAKRAMPAPAGATRLRLARRYLDTCG